VPDQGLPQPQPPTGAPPGVNWPTFPSNPIAPGGSPGAPTHPIAPGGGGGSPSHPIAVPPPSVWVPVFPTNPIAPGGGNEKPDQSLPGSQPGVGTLPSGSFILVWSPQYGWILVAQGGQPPVSQGPGGEIDNSLPGAQPKPDQGLPGSQPKPDQSLPPHAQPKK